MVIALDRSTLRKVEADQTKTISKASDPRKFKYKHTCTKWELQFENYISTIPGINGVPLLYIVRAQAYPDNTTDFQRYFISETISCAQLSGTHFQADTRKLHQLLKDYLVAETDEQWISII